MDPNLMNREKIILALQTLNNNSSTNDNLREANKYLLDCEATNFVFLVHLLEIYENNKNNVIGLQALIYFNNIIKKNWQNKRINKNSPNFQSDKTGIKTRLIGHLTDTMGPSRKSLLDVIVFISKIDYPHSFNQLSAYILNAYMMINSSGPTNESLTHIRGIEMVYKQQLDRKTYISRKVFEQVSMPILVQSFLLSNKIQIATEQNPTVCKIYRKNMKILLMILATAPPEIVQIQDIHQLLQSIYQQLETLVTGRKEEKTIKCLLEYLSYVQQQHSFLLTYSLKNYASLVVYVFLNFKKEILKFAIINLVKILKCFNYYADDTAFFAANNKNNKIIRSAQFHKICRQVFHEVFTKEVVQNLLNECLTNTLSIRESEFEVSTSIEEDDAKIQDKENSIHNLTMMMIETLFIRFCPYSLNLFKQLICSASSQQFSGIPDNILNNIFAVLAIVPKAAKNNQNSEVAKAMPTLSTIQFIFKSGKFKDKFALLCCKWLNWFSKEEVSGILQVLLGYLSQETRVDILLECCLAVKTIVLEKSSDLDMTQAVQKIVPVAIALCSSNDATQVLWPMITLISKILTKVVVNHDLLLGAFTTNALTNLLQNPSQVIIQALADMIKNLLCIFPRNKPIQIVFSMAMTFLEAHIKNTQQTCFPSVLQVWYLVMRQYHFCQGINSRIISFFDHNFRKCIHTQHQTLLYILQQYVLLDLVQPNMSHYLTLLNDFYMQSDDRQETVALKSAVLSVHITFITKFGIEQTHSNDLLVKYLMDFVGSSQLKAKSESSFRNSLLTLLNRYLILHKQGFLQFVNSVGMDSNVFFKSWIDNMEHLTSRSACKINAIAILLLLPELSHINIEVLLRHVVPEVQYFMKNKHIDNSFPFSEIMVSPSNRLSDSVLSQRKEDIRRKGVFEQYNLLDLYRKQFGEMFMKYGMDRQKLEGQLMDKALATQTFSLFN